MSLLHATTTTASQHRAEASDYDHQIILEDATSKPTPRQSLSVPGSPSLDPADPPIDEPPSPRPSEAPLGRKWTLREELARRKYARWQEERYGAGGGEADGRSQSDGDGVDAGNGRGARRRSKRASVGGSVVSDEHGAELDVLYENQRGSFFWGIPLFSHQSLLNLDPSPWQTATFKDSPVDVTNAQPPDPSWQWEWKTWRVDMSSDVDDEGWQYSFSFSPAFSWHGTHVWFHSFVRRRRWLRKRVRRPVPASKRNSLATDDFLSQTSSRRASISASTAPSAVLDDASSVRSLPALMRALRSGRIDREKIEATEAFLTHASDGDVAGLAERIPTVMTALVFQASRGQLLALLTKHYDDAAEDSPRREALLPAVRAADAAVRRLEYWSDITGIARAGDSKGAADAAQGWGESWAGVDGSGGAQMETKTDRANKGKGREVR